MTQSQPKPVIFICLIFFPALLSCTVIAQQISAVDNYALNRPGVVMVKTVFSANVYVKNMKIDNRRFNLLLDSIQRIDTNGIVFTAEQKLDIVLKEMNNNPSRFFKPTYDYIKQPEEITATGTGFFITGDGFVATNSHLTDRDNAFIRRHFILSAFQQITDANINALEQSWATTFTEQQRSLLYNTYASVYSRLFSMVLNDLRKNIYIVYRKDSSDRISFTETKSASVIIKGSPMPGKDVAILKIDSVNNLPTLKINSPQLPRVGEQVYVFGYPAPVTNNDFVSAESSIEPTLTTGIVSAVKKSVNGWPVLQMDANINHGSSGGPVCNSNGEVIGLTTFGSIENNGNLAAGLNFAIPVSILKDFLDSINVAPALSKTTILFQEGLDCFNQHYYRKALGSFEKIKKLDNNYPTADYYITICKTKIDNGEDRTTKTIKESLLILVFILLALILFIAFRRKK
ncbi:MAG: trypsin-like peptidase domain-containing protein [Bacteroidota bacterium]